MSSIAIVCPIGNLDRHGYQYIYRECIASMVSFADTVYLPHTTRNRAGVDELIMAYEDIVYINDDSTWFDLVEGHERFDLCRIRDNVNRCLAQARVDDHDIALCVEVNQYIPKAARESLRELCRDIRAHDQPIGWLYRRDQLADTTFHASLRRPWIWNLDYDARLEVPDGAIVAGQFIRHVRGNWPEEDGTAVVDAQLEMTLDDLQEKLEFFRFYTEFVPKRPTTFDWTYWRDYSVAKFKQKERDNVPLDLYGDAIAQIAQAHPDFLSHEVLSLL